MTIRVKHSSRDTIDLTRLRWRFVICTASFYVNAIAWGFTSSAGIFEDAFKSTYRLSSFRSSLPGSVQIATMSVFSVLASILTMKYGVRWTTLSGAFISTIGSILAAVIGDYWIYCVCYGLFVGIGEAFVLVPAVMAIPSYFRSDRVSLATASAVSGTSVGTFAIPLLLQHLIHSYGLHGTTLLGSCLWLSVALSGALYGHGVTSREEKHNRANDNASIATKNETSTEHLSAAQHQSNTSNGRLIYSRRTSLLPASFLFNRKSTRFSSLFEQYYKSDLITDDASNNLDVPGLSLEVKSRSDKITNILFSSVNSSPIVVRSRTNQSTISNAHALVSHNDHNHLPILPGAHVAHMADNVIYKQINEFRQSEQSLVQSSLQPDRVDFCCKMFSEIRGLLRINLFRVLMVSIILVWSLDEANLLFLTDLLKLFGQPEQRSTLLISIIGCTDLIGQLFFGYLGDIASIDPLVLWACTSAMAGLTLSAVTSIGSHGLVSLCIIVALHALCLAAPNALGNVIMIEVVGMDRYPITYGFSLLVSGATALIGYPLLGLIRDKTQSWTIPFAIVGSMMMLGGLIAGTIPLYAFCNDGKSKSNGITIVVE